MINVKRKKTIRWNKGWHLQAPVYNKKQKQIISLKELSPVRSKYLSPERLNWIEPHWCYLGAIQFKFLIKKKKRSRDRHQAAFNLILWHCTTLLIFSIVGKQLEFCLVIWINAKLFFSKQHINQLYLKETFYKEQFMKYYYILLLL